MYKKCPFALLPLSKQRPVSIIMYLKCWQPEGSWWYLDLHEESGPLHAMLSSDEQLVETQACLILQFN